MLEVKMNKKARLNLVGILVISCIFVTIFSFHVLGEEWNVIKTIQTWTNSGGINARTGKEGVNFNVSMELYLINISVFEGTGAPTKAYLSYANETSIQISNVTNYIAQFDEVLLIPGTEYSLKFDSLGESYTCRGRYGDTPTLPYTVEPFIITSTTTCNYATTKIAILQNLTYGFSGNISYISFNPTTTQTGTHLQDYIFANITSYDNNWENTTIYLYNNTGLVSSITNTTSGNFTYTFTLLPLEKYYLNATSYDTAGNSNSTETYTIWLDNNYGNGSDGSLIFTDSEQSYGNLILNTDYKVSGSTLYLKADKVFNFVNFELGSGRSIKPLGTGGSTFYILVQGDAIINGTIYSNNENAETPTRGKRSDFDSGVDNDGVISAPNVVGGAGGAGGNSWATNFGYSGGGGSENNGFGGGGGGGGAASEAAANGGGGGPGRRDIGRKGIGGYLSSDGWLKGACLGMYGLYSPTEGRAGGGGAAACDAYEPNIKAGDGSETLGVSGQSGSISTASGTNEGAAAAGGGGHGGNAGYSGVHIYIKAKNINFLGVIDTSGTNGGSGSNGGNGVSHLRGTFSGAAASGGGGGGGGGGGSSGNIIFFYNREINDGGSKIQTIGSKGNGGSAGSSSAQGNGNAGTGNSGSNGVDGEQGTFSSTFEEPPIEILSPTPSQIFTQDSPTAFLNISTALEMDTCNYNNGSTNFSMTKTNTTYFHANAGPTLLDGLHTVSFFCNQTSDGTWRESDSVSFEIDPINITTCRNLNMNNRIYNLQNNLNSAGDCLEIKGNNITLGGNYRTITGPGSSPSAIGIKVTGQNSTIQDVTINSFTTRIQYSSSNYNVLKDSTFGGFSATTHRIIDYVNSNNNEINNVSVSGNSGTNFYGIYLSESSNNEVEDYVSSSNTGTSNRYDVYATSNSRNNIFLSSDFSYEYTSATSNFSRQWYFDTQVNDSLGNPIDLAVVKIWDSESRLIYDGVTFATGRAAQQKLVEYNHHQGSKVTTTPHLVNVSKSTYITNSSSINVNNDYFHEVNLFNEDSSSPSITIHSPLSESTNSLIQLINITANDDYGVDKIWYNWNGTNLTYSIPINTEFNEGIINLFVYANDTSGNDNFTNVSFTIDTLSPNVTMTPESKTIMFGEEFGDAIATSASKSSFESFSYTVSASNEEDFEMTLGGSGGCGAPVGGERTTTCSHTYYFSWVEQLSVGTYTNTINYTDSFGNSAWKTFELNITQDDGSCDVLFDETSPLTYPNTFRVYSNCDTPFTLKRNGTEISNNSIQSLGAGIYNFSVQRTDTQNYSNVYDEELFTLNKATTSLSVSGTSPINYGTAGDVQGTGCPAQLSCNLYREGTLVSNPDTTILNAGIYNYIYNTTGNENYTSDSDNFELTVIEIDAGCSIQFNKDSPLIYPDTFNVWHTCSIPATIYRNGSVVSNNSLQSLGAGTYNFSVTADEPGSYINTSDEKLFTINRKNSQLSLVFDKSSPQTYGGTITPTCSVIHGENTPILRLDGGIITSGNPLLLGAGNYNFSCSLTESQNYTSSLNESSFTINKAVPDMVAYLNGVINSISINYPSTVNASASTNAGTLGMWRNGTNVLGENNLGVLLGSGYYSYKFNVTGNENYTDVSDVYLYANVGKSSSPCNVLFNESSPKIVGNVFEVYSNCDSPFTLRRGETNVENNSVQDLAIGVYTFNVNRTDTQNYSNVYDSKNFEITDKLIPEINLTFDKVSPQTYGTEINVSCTTNSDGVLTLTRNGIDVTGELNTFVLLGADSHTYICSVTETATYNSNQQQSIFGINRATSGVYTYLNNSRSNLEINEGTGIWLNGTLETGIGSIKLYNNGILINQGISPLSNLTLFSTVGVYNITTIYEETQNYSSSYESFNVTVKDISLPEVTINSPQNISYSNKNILLDISSSDNIEVYSVWYNWEGTNQTYFSPQTIEFNEGSNTLFAYANDTSGNENFTSVTFFVDTIAPSINILYPEATNYGNTAFDLNYSVYDAGVGVHSCWFKIVGSTRGIIVNNQTLDGCTNSTFNVPGGDTYTLTLYSNDTLNNLNSESVVFGVNLESPFIELNNPSDNKYLNYKENILFNFTVTDGDGIGTCELWGDWNGWHKNQTLNSVSSGVQTSFGLINLNDGNYKWNVWCNDSLGNGDFSLNNFTLTIDTVYPLFGFGIGTEENYANKSQSNIYINTTWTEINFKNITFRANSNTQSFSTPTYYHNFVGLGNGVYTYNVTICDLADNCNSTGNRIITLDTINPNVTLMSPANETVTNIPEQNLTANMTDANLKNITLEIYNESGILINQTDIDTGSSGVIGIVYTFSEGVFSWLYKAWDWAGNLFTSEKRTITVDLTSPGITIVSPTNTTYSNSTQLLSISTSDNFVVESILYNWKGTNYTYTGPTNIILTAGSNHLIVYANDTAGNTNSSELYSSLDYEDDIEIVFFKTSSTPELGETINLQVETKTNNLNITSCNFSLVSPTKNIFINELGISDNNLFNEVWTSTSSYLINETGTYTFNVTCVNEMGGYFSSFSTFAIDYNLTYSPLNYSFASRVSPTEQNNITIYMYDNSNSSIIYDISMNVTNQSNFTLNYPSTITLNDLDSSLNQYTFSTSIAGKEGISNGTYFGNISLTNRVSGEITIIPFVYGIRPPSGIPQIRTTLDSPCNRTSGNCDNTVLSLTQGSSTTLNYKVTNIGLYNLSSCNVMMSNSLEQGWATSAPSSFSLEQLTSREISITLFPTTSVQAKTYEGFIYVYCGSGDALGSAIESEVSNRPYLRLQVLTSTAPPSGGGGGGGGGGGIDLESPEKVPPKVEDIVGICGNAICEPDFGENPQNCPQDCKIDYTGLTACFSSDPKIREECILFKGTSLFYIFTFIVLVILFTLFFTQDKKKRTITKIKFGRRKR
jgi:hypothetical protein